MADLVANRGAIITGRILSGLAIVALGLDAMFKIATPALMIANSPPLGLAPDPDLYRTIGTILLIGVVLYAWPRTAVIGAVLITAFLGGAVAINLRAGMPLFTNTLFGVYVGLFVWAGLYLRAPQLRAVIHGG